jgi:hypothetical protein
VWLAVFNSGETTALANDEIWNKMSKINITEGGSRWVSVQLFLHWPSLTIIIEKICEEFYIPGPKEIEA